MWRLRRSLKIRASTSTEAALRGASAVGHFSLPVLQNPSIQISSESIVEQLCAAPSFNHAVVRSSQSRRRASRLPPPGLRDISGAPRSVVRKGGSVWQRVAAVVKCMKNVRRRRGEQLGWRPPLVERRGSASLRMPSAPSAGREVTTADYANLRLMLHYSTTTPTLRGGVPASDVKQHACCSVSARGGVPRSPVRRGGGGPALRRII